ncbi:MAG: hypothetical protein JSW11_19965 [Candidatus Heimdallarchaeota archaeon]|nr:MAG: hypothetical protein JSW11_19965 [Candidatus Heimdallarchaeota archaeon]
MITDNRVHTARNLWVIATALGCMRPILNLGHNLSLWITNPILPSLFDFLGLALIAYTTLRYPEAILLSKIQFIRAIKLYKVIQSFQTQKQVNNFGFLSLVEYLRKLPPEIITGFEIE